MPHIKISSQQGLHTSRLLLKTLDKGGDHSSDIQTSLLLYGISYARKSLWYKDCIHNTYEAA